jgi:dihydroneopterin aldolase
MNTKNMDVIRIDGLVIHANHGVLEEENRLGQRFIISAKLYGALSEAKKTDNVENTVNYAKVCDLIEKITQEKTYNLIEALAHTLAFSILE